MKLKGEDLEQQTLFQYASLQPDPRWELLFAIPNGGHRHKTTGMLLKATGLKAGIPDICFPVASDPCNGLFIEMKFGKGRVQPAQAVWHNLLREQGYAVEVCYGAIDAIDTIKRYLDGYFERSEYNVVTVLRSQEGSTQV